MRHSEFHFLHFTLITFSSLAYSALLLFSRRPFPEALSLDHSSHRKGAAAKQNRFILKNAWAGVCSA